MINDGFGKYPIIFNVKNEKNRVTTKSIIRKMIVKEEGDREDYTYALH